MNILQYSPCVRQRISLVLSFAQTTWTPGDGEIYGAGGVSPRLGYRAVQDAAPARGQ